MFLPQVHQVLPRLARLMVALRHAFCGPFREECSFLFVVAGAGRAGMGLHQDGAVDSFWLQLEGRRTVTTGPQVPRGTRADLDEKVIGRGWVIPPPTPWSTRNAINPCMFGASPHSSDPTVNKPIVIR